MIRNKQIRVIAAHAVVWLCFITYEVSVAVTMGSKAGFWEFAVFYVLNILLFYFNSEVVFRFARNPKKVALVLIPFIGSELAVYTILSLLIGVYIYRSQNHWSQVKIVRDDTVRALWRGVYFIGLSTGYWFFKRSITVTREANRLSLLQLKAEKSKAESDKSLAITQVAYLRAQINPHFLFNTLNYIFNTVDVLSAEASSAILLLSDMMRYSLAETEDDGKVPLSEEIAHIKRYVTLTQLRFSNELFVALHIDMSEDSGSCRVPPLILLTFVENVFKHGDLTDKENPATIKVSYARGELHLSTRNLKRKSLMPPGTRIGIENARTRLNLYYQKEDFHLSVNSTLTHFFVELRILI
ncbi:MAG: sensor histidine kinase [Bacteroidetes bacterium]|nr:sensor histidine kinase [Bacteroidota bacterium]